VLLAEDLLHLVTDHDSGKLSAPEMKVDLGLGGANLVELTLMHKVDITREGDEGKGGRLIVRDSTLTGDRVLDAALEIVIGRQAKTSQQARLSRRFQASSKDWRLVRATAPTSRMHLESSEST
jgi:hypothetical protein